MATEGLIHSATNCWSFLRRGEADYKHWGEYTNESSLLAFFFYLTYLRPAFAAKMLWNETLWPIFTSFRMTPVHGADGTATSSRASSAVAVSQRERINGWSCPWHPLQFVAWFFLIFFSVFYFGVIVFYLPKEWRAAGFIVSFDLHMYIEIFSVNFLIFWFSRSVYDFIVGNEYLKFWFC